MKKEQLQQQKHSRIDCKLLFYLIFLLFAFARIDILTLATLYSCIEWLAIINLTNYLFLPLFSLLSLFFVQLFSNFFFMSLTILARRKQRIDTRFPFRVKCLATSNGEQTKKWDWMRTRASHMHKTRIHNTDKTHKEIDSW